MKKQDYVVCRNNIYVGHVARVNKYFINKVSDDEDNDDFSAILVNDYTIYRSILFTPNQENQAQDLLYDSPNYSIINSLDAEEAYNVNENSIIIIDACNLNQLLEYFNYNDILAIEDIIKLRKKFFTGKFTKDNAQLFGWKEIKVNDLKIYNMKNKKEFVKRQRKGYRLFYNIEKNNCFEEYWDVLDEYGNNNIFDIIKGKEKRIDVFKPIKEEGKIKKLIK